MKKHSTLERLDLAREIRILALGLIGSLIMAINIKSFVHTGGLYPGGFNGVTLLIQTSFSAFFRNIIAIFSDQSGTECDPGDLQFSGYRQTLYAQYGSDHCGHQCIHRYRSSYADHAGHPADQCVWRSDQRCCDQFVSDRRDFNGRNGFHCCVFSGKKNRDVWNFILMGNATVLVLAGLLFGWDKALYSIIFQFTSTQMIHLLYQEHNKITLFIVTELPYEIYQEIMVTVHHSATEISATGMYSQEPKTMLYCVVSSTEAKIVTRKILEADPKALINVIKTETFKGRFHQTRHY